MYVPWGMKYFHVFVWLNCKRCLLGKLEHKWNNSRPPLNLQTYKDSEGEDFALVLPVNKKKHNRIFIHQYPVRNTDKYTRQPVHWCAINQHLSCLKSIIIISIIRTLLWIISVLLKWWEVPGISSVHFSSWQEQSGWEGYLFLWKIKHNGTLQTNIKQMAWPVLTDAILWKENFGANQETYCKHRISWALDPSVTLSTSWLRQKRGDSKNQCILSLSYRNIVISKS